MKAQRVKMLATVLLLGVFGFGTNDAHSQTFSSFEYNQASNTVLLEWLNSTNAFCEMQASTNLMTGLWGQEGGWTNFLGTNPTNSIHLSVDGYINGYFRLIARTNALQQSTIFGMAFRSNTNLLFAGFSGVPPQDVSILDFVGLWDETNSYYYGTRFQGRSGWMPYLSISNNQSFFYIPYRPEDAEYPPSEWTHAYLKDWRLISPEDLPVTGDVLIEWAAFENYSTPTNPLPDIPFIDVTVMNSDELIVTNWHLGAPVGSSVIWESDSNPDGYYIIKVEVAGLETIEKQVYLYK